MGAAERDGDAAAARRERASDADAAGVRAGALRRGAVLSRRGEGLRDARERRDAGRADHVEEALGSERRARAETVAVERGAGADGGGASAGERARVARAAGRAGREGARMVRRGRDARGVDRAATRGGRDDGEDGGRDDAKRETERMIGI